MRRARSSGCTAIAETFIATLPGYTDGPKDIRGRLEDGGEPLLLKQLVEGFAGWVMAYNAERPHRSLNGLTPQARFTGDPTPLVLVAPEDARRLLLARRSARVRRDGVHHGGLPHIGVPPGHLSPLLTEGLYKPNSINFRGRSPCPPKRRRSTAWVDLICGSLVRMNGFKSWLFSGGCTS